MLISSLDKPLHIDKDDTHFVSEGVWNLKLYISCESNQDDIQINVSLLDPVKTVKNSYKQDNI